MAPDRGRHRPARTHPQRRSTDGVHGRCGRDYRVPVGTQEAVSLKGLPVSERCRRYDRLSKRAVLGRSGFPACSGRPDASIRDSKNPDGPVLFVTRSAWSAFVGSLR
ncbi:DUF397 domain-containing protein [Streptomyces massasporeus]|uniref:DUF397 domain-containing protein n=1 Tax=Streptomyces massasporeus TaxID=67324 RepID=UPI0037F7F153